MGITSQDVILLEKAFSIKEIKSVIELGSQNLYLEHHEKPPFADQWYEKKGILSYTAIDMAGDNHAKTFNLARPFEFVNQPGSPVKAHLVTDFGTSEHVADVEYEIAEFHEGHIHSMYPKVKPTATQVAMGYYNCWKNKHDLTAVGGLILSVNPKTGNWPDHGYTYIDKFFYAKLAAYMRYEIIHLGESAAMGNTTDGWNIECILQKTEEREFISYADFQNCDQFVR